jgi:hypothetical protein
MCADTLLGFNSSLGEVLVYVTWGYVVCAILLAVVVVFPIRYVSCGVLRGMVCCNAPLDELSLPNRGDACGIRMSFGLGALRRMSSGTLHSSDCVVGRRDADALVVGYCIALFGLWTIGGVAAVTLRWLGLR